MTDRTQSQQAMHPERKTSQRLVLGMGTGRCGTHTLAQLLSRQPDTSVTHEQPPLLPWQVESGRNVIAARLERMIRTRPQQLVGDIATFYLPYMEAALTLEPRMRVVCLERPREEVVTSFCAWLDAAHPLPTDHWSAEPGDGWYHEPVWTRIFPKYATNNRAEGIRRYWKEYHERATDLTLRFPENVRIFPMAEALNTEAGMRDLLSFVGVPRAQQVLLLGEVQARASATAPHPRRSVLATAGPRDPARCAVLVPYSDYVLPACEQSLRVLEQRGYTVSRIAAGSGLCQARNQMVTDVLTEGFEETLWVGSDIAFDPDDVERLRGHGESIICGLYPEAGMTVLASHVLPGTPHILFGTAGGVVEIRHAAAGFLLVRRSVYMDMIRQLKLPLCNDHVGRALIPFFQTRVIDLDDGSWFLAEDHAFCDAARDCGYRVLADSTIRLWRQGLYSYSWEDAGQSPARYTTYHLNLG